MCQVMRPPCCLVGGADGAAKPAWRQRGVALARRQAADSLHAAEEAERVGVSDDALLIDDAGKLGDFEETDGQCLFFEHARATQGSSRR